MSHKTKVKLEVLLPDSGIDLVSIGLVLLGMAYTSEDPVVVEFAEDLFQAISVPLDADTQMWGGKPYSVECREFFDRLMNSRKVGIQNLLRMTADRFASLPPDETNEPKPT